MNDFQKIEKIDSLLRAIKWPDDANMYFTTSHTLNGLSRGITCSVYISVCNEDNSSHSFNNGDFGKYLTITSKDLDDTIKILESFSME